MNRKDLSFLSAMFVNNILDNFHILIVNQTSKENILKSEFSNIRVINSFEKGLSKSRNLAIKNAIGDVCLIADDDVEYVKDFDKIIKEGYTSFSDADCIVFNSNISGKVRNPKYLNNSKKIKKIKECFSVSSVEISFKRQSIQSNKIIFDELLGLNSEFKSGEEYVFLNVVFQKLNLYYEDKIILKHKTISTGAKISLMEIVPIYAVQYHLTSPNLFYFEVIKLLMYLIIHNKIKVSNTITVLKICINARNKYVQLKKNT